MPFPVHGQFLSFCKYFLSEVGRGHKGLLPSVWKRSWMISRNSITLREGPTSGCCWLHGGHQPPRRKDPAQIEAGAQHGVGAAHQRLRAAAQTAEPCYGGRQQSCDSTCETSRYQTEPTTLMKLSPVAFAITCEEVVPVVMDVPMVGRGIVMTGSVWLRASCC